MSYTMIVRRFSRRDIAEDVVALLADEMGWQTQLVYIGPQHRRPWAVAVPSEDIYASLMSGSN